MASTNNLVYAGVEAGGTTFKAAIAKEEQGEIKIIETAIFPTRKPKETLDDVVSWLEARKFDSLGIACFGPVDLDPSSKTYGFITSTPKEGWQHTDVLGRFKQFGKPIGFDTDVNAPAVAEIQYGKHGDGITSCCYITVGTGIGVGVVCNNQAVHGLMHPEAGHLYAPICAADLRDKFSGTCPFHKDCIEGMANSNAIATRRGVHPSQLQDLADDDEVWETTAHYLAHLCTTLTLVVSPQVIVLGGGVFRRRCLVPKIRAKTLQLLNNYIQVPRILEQMDKYITLSIHGDDSGIMGALALAKTSYTSCAMAPLCN